ncbi:MAG: triose-phosphate isomerase [Gammaproteobacteria bacterium PRO9]|nr:triose-phosphate isomerase [Gammaproteobacteria bacterium PRO9]
MSCRRPLVAGNWKLHGDRRFNETLVAGIVAGLAEAGLSPPVLAGATAPVDVVLCPPSVYLAQVAGLVADTGMSVGAQDVSVEKTGAYTGAVAAAMLTDVGCRHVIVGHSERRALFGDTDAGVGAKAIAALEAGLVPIICVGETLAERDGLETLAVVRRQIGAVLAACEARDGSIKVLAPAIIAYEPVWAIGTGRTATPAQAQEVHADIRATVAQRDATIAGGLRILYGGSVKASNARDLFAMQDIDGGLVGGASLEAAGFVSICKAAAG